MACAAAASGVGEGSDAEGVGAAAASGDGCFFAASNRTRTAAVKVMAERSNGNFLISRVQLCLPLLICFSRAKLKRACDRKLGWFQT